MRHRRTVSHPQYFPMSTAHLKADYDNYSSDKKSVRTDNSLTRIARVYYYHSRPEIEI